MVPAGDPSTMRLNNAPKRFALGEAAGAAKAAVAADSRMSGLARHGPCHQRQEGSLAGRNPPAKDRRQGFVGQAKIDAHLPGHGQNRFTHARQKVDMLMPVDEIRAPAQDLGELFDLAIDFGCDCALVQLPQIGGAHQGAKRTLLGQGEMQADIGALEKRLQQRPFGGEIRRHHHAARRRQPAGRQQVANRPADARRDAVIVGAEHDAC